MKHTPLQLFRKFLRANHCEHQFDRNFYLQCGANYLDEGLVTYVMVRVPLHSTRVAVI